MKRFLTRLDDTRRRFGLPLLARVKPWLCSEELLLSASVLFLPVLYMTAALALLSGVGKGIELGRWVFPVGLLLWGVAVVALHRREGWQRLAATLLLFLAVFALVAFLASLTLDRGFDSRLYHAHAILALLEGVNPYWESNHWVTNSYPAAHWLLSASLVVWTQSFEASFAFTLVAAFASFLCARCFFVTMPHLSSVWRNVLAFLLAANPIATWGFFTHITDGLLASMLLSVFLLMLSFVADDGARSRRARLRGAIYIAALLVLLINIKFTGLVFGGILGVTALAYGVRRGVSRKTLLRLAGLGCGAAILGVVVFGFFPYATNVAQGKHPFYPAIKFDEKGKRIDIFEQSGWMGPEFYNKSSYEKWWISLFSKNGKSWLNTAPLPPFSSLGVHSFHFGFGSFFSGALLLCLTLVFFVRHRGAWIVMAGVMLSVLSTGVSFEFRLTPQNWWLPLLFLVFLLAPDDKKSLLSRAQTAVVFVVTACLFYVSVQRLKHDGRRAINAGSTVRLLEEQGGWFVVPDLAIKEGDVDNHGFSEGFFRYYKSGLTGVRLPTRERCPEKTERRTLIPGLVLCKLNS